MTVFIKIFEWYDNMKRKIIGKSFNLVFASIRILKEHKNCHEISIYSIYHSKIRLVGHMKDVKS